MPLFHPISIAIHEDNPASVDHYRIQARSETEVVLADGTYPATPGGDTLIPIGSNGFFNNITSGTTIKLYVIEMLTGEPDAPAQFVERYIVKAIPDGADDIVVNY